MTTVRNLLFTLLFGWIGLLPTVSLSQVVLSGGVTISGGYTVPGTWSDFVRRATVAVGQIKKDQVGVDRFTTGGAAVIIRDSRDRIFLATALHVFYEPSKNWAPETLQIRGWRDERKDRYKDFGAVLSVRSNGKPLYIASTKFDLALVPVTQDIVNRLLDDDHKIFTIDPTMVAGVE